MPCSMEKISDPLHDVSGFIADYDRLAQAGHTADSSTDVLPEHHGPSSPVSFPRDSRRNSSEALQGLSDLRISSVGAPARISNQYGQEQAVPGYSFRTDRSQTPGSSQGPAVTVPTEESPDETGDGRGVAQAGESHGGGSEPSRVEACYHAFAVPSACGNEVSPYPRRSQPKRVAWTKMGAPFTTSFRQNRSTR